MISEIEISTSSNNEFIDITDKIKNIVSKSKVKNGLCNIFVPHATAAITLNENADPNMPKDIISALRKMVKEHDGWLHDSIDNNAAAHIKSSIVGSSQTIPIKNGELVLGTWQDIFLCDFDGPRKRKVVITIIGE